MVQPASCQKEILQKTWKTNVPGGGETVQGSSSGLSIINNKTHILYILNKVLKLQK